MANDRQNADSTSAAQDYAERQASTYNQQSQKNSSDNRAHMDNSYPDSIGGAKEIKPVPPSCDGRQFAENPYDSHNYLDVRFDKWNNVIAEDRSFHNSGAVGDQGRAGNYQFSSATDDLQSTGYGSNMGLNEIPYGQSAAFNESERTFVDNSKADRGKES
jgi:hypothetical protein